jgi:hypothetical protein
VVGMSGSSVIPNGSNRMLTYFDTNVCRSTPNCSPMLHTDRHRVQETTERGPLLAELDEDPLWNCKAGVGRSHGRPTPDHSASLPNLSVALRRRARNTTTVIAGRRL